MGLCVFQQGARTGGTVAISLKVAALGIAAAVFQHLGAVQILAAQIIAGHGDSLIELVDDRLGRGSVGAVLRDGRDTHRDDVAVGIGRADALQELLVVCNKGIHADRAIDIVGAKLHKNAAGLHLGNRLRDRIIAGIRCKVDTGGRECLGGLEPLLPDKLIQRDAAVLLQGDGVLVTGKDAGRDVGIVCSGLRQHSLQRCVQRIGILIIGACTTGEKPQLGRQHPRCQNTQNDCQRTERQHNTGLALCRAEALLSFIRFAAHRKWYPPYVWQHRPLQRHREYTVLLY